MVSRNSISIGTASDVRRHPAISRNRPSSYGLYRRIPTGTARRAAGAIPVRHGRARQRGAQHRVIASGGRFTPAAVRLSSRTLPFAFTSASTPGSKQTARLIVVAIAASL